MSTVAGQQRTLSRTRLDPGQGPLPVMFTGVLASSPSVGITRITFPQPIRIQGIPPILNQLGLPPISVTPVGTSAMDLNWATTPQLGDVLTVPDWSPSMRGLNGEWVSGGPLLLGGSVNGGLPDLVWVTAVDAIGANTALWTFSADFSPEGLVGLRVNGVDGTSFSQPDTFQVAVVYTAAPSAGDQWTIAPWSPQLYSTTDTVWAAPGVGLLG